MTVAASRFLLRAMTVLDIPRVSVIERESFPTMWPQTAYRRELQRNKLAAYLVICEQTDGESAARRSPAVEPLGTGHPAVRPATHPGLLARLRRLFGANAQASIAEVAAAPEQIAGFVGLWFMVDEAHVVTIAVAETYRRQGLGEMLLIAAIELAQHREQEVVTLECRVSNAAALALYEKYGFRQVGLRKRYYTDNNEDAAIMTTFPIRSTEFEAEFARLRAGHAARRGTPRIAHPEL
jgi:[ribosomal protein S18]-alanine N-acetyltransferase